MNVTIPLSNSATFTILVSNISAKYNFECTIKEKLCGDSDMLFEIEFIKTLYSDQRPNQYFDMLEEIYSECGEKSICLL